MTDEPKRKPAALTAFRTVCLLLLVVALGVFIYSSWQPMDMSSSSGGDMLQYITWLESSDREERLNGVYGLGNMGAGAGVAIPNLVRALDDPDGAIRAAAALAIAEIGGAEAKTALPGLIRLVEGKDARGRDSAMYALRTIGGKAGDAVPALVNLLSHDDPAVRINALTTLGAIGPTAKGAVLSIIQLINDEDENVQRAVVDALAKIAPKE